jgi:thiol-disulfide isomerase/thioredoxin
MIITMKNLLLCICVFLCAHFAYAQSQPTVVVDNLVITHEPRGWRVISASITPVHFNLLKGDLIVRIDGKNASEAGPMLMANLLNQGDRRQIKLFIERGDFPMETELQEILTEDYSPVGPNPFRRVASGFSAPDAEFKDIDGQPGSLAQFKGKWLLINFMATWCPPCAETLPKVLSIADHHQLSLLMIALNDKPDAVRRMQRQYKINAPIAMMQVMSQLPIDFGITTNRWTGQVPALALIRPDGDVALIEIGGVDENRIEKAIE